jgi:hypothetical protein
MYWFISLIVLIGYCYGQICSDKDTIALTDGSIDLFTVDRVSKVTKIHDLQAEKCQCGDVDVDELQKTINTLTTQVEMLMSTTLKPATSLYYVWGRQTCSDARSSLLFAGEAVARNQFDLYCVNATADPQGFVAASGSIGIQTVSLTSTSSTVIPPSYTSEAIVVCAACETPSTHVEMFIGRISCPSSDWRLLYNGWLVTGKLVPHGFVCLHETADGTVIGSGDRSIERVQVGGGGGSIATHVSKSVRCAVCARN